MNGAAGEEEKPCPRPPRQDQKPAQRRATPVQHATRGKQRRYFVGDVASAKLVKTQMAKSTLDAGWAMLKTMWEYKSHQAGVVFEVVNESHSTQTCSCCGAIPASGPKRWSRTWNKRMGLQRMWHGTRPRHKRRQKHSRGGTSPSFQGGEDVNTLLALPSRGPQTSEQRRGV